MRHALTAAALLAASATTAAIAPGASAAWAAEPGIAVFDLELLDTSGAATTPEEAARVRQATQQLREGLGQPGRYSVVSTDPVQQRVARGPALRTCNTCSLDAARALGADYAAHAWVQKVSNLILNVTLVVEDAATGRTVYGDSVDIRGNTDDSWRRGVRYLLEERMFRDGARPGALP